MYVAFRVGLQATAYSMTNLKSYMNIYAVTVTRSHSLRPINLPCVPRQLAQTNIKVDLCSIRLVVVRLRRSRTPSRDVTGLPVSYL
jgi:hypothetical protein